MKKLYSKYSKTLLLRGMINGRHWSQPLNCHITILNLLEAMFPIWIIAKRNTTPTAEKAVNNLPMGYPILQQPPMGTPGQPHINSMGMSSCHVVNGVPNPSNFHPIQMNSRNESMVMDGNAGGGGGRVTPIPVNGAISAMSDMPISPTSVASSGHSPFTTSELSGMGVDTSALDTEFTSDVASTVGLHLPQDNGNSRSFGKIPWNFSLSGLTTDLSNLGDLGALGNYPGSAFLPSDSDILLDSPEQEDIVEEFFVDSVPGPHNSQSDEDKA
ncbi:unnamed protein product [Lactuca saligna]|uniref:Uncharacterized protein n=1 Tax=Lactuca saligna TaxID=75948 RepID=A0AA35Y5R5_LACSI|nr:unnamed protein product [Lactuca saligna]